MVRHLCGGAHEADRAHPGQPEQAREEGHRGPRHHRRARQRHHRRAVRERGEAQ